MRYEAILWRLTQREATYLQFRYFRGRRKRGKEKEAESTCLDYIYVDLNCTYLAAIKSLFCFPILKSYLIFILYVPLPQTTTTNSTYTVGDAIDSVSIYPVFAVQVTIVLWIVMLVARCTICKCLRRNCET